MPVSVIVGGQYGSEGKGKIAAYLAKDVQHAVRSGGPNAGHTVSSCGKVQVFRHLPCACCIEEVRLYLSAGALIDLQVLSEELIANGVSSSRLVVDPCACVIDRDHIESEASLVAAIGSTGKGVGSAVAAKVLRKGGVKLARDEPQLHSMLGNVADLLHCALQSKDRILIEGTQGTGLSLHHGEYPHVTSRDVTAGSLCGEVGVGPTAVDQVILVVRTYPIRVAGPSGPFAFEIDWDEVTRRSGYREPIREYTTVTRKLRRVAEFDIGAVVRAVRLNGATEIALTFVDYLDATARDTSRLDSLPRIIRTFVDQLEDAASVPVTLIGTGPDTESMIDRR